MYKGNPISLSVEFSANKTLPEKREWHDIFQMMKEKSFQEVFTYQGYHSELKERLRVFQTDKS